MFGPNSKVFSLILVSSKRVSALIDFPSGLTRTQNPYPGGEERGGEWCGSTGVGRGGGGRGVKKGMKCS